MKLQKHRRCSRSAFGMHHIASDSDSATDYLVQINMSGEHVCTCPNYVITRNRWKKLGKSGYRCKHILRALDKHSCDWSTETSDERHKYKTVCPRCYALTEEYYETPESVTDEDVQRALDSMREHLKGIRVRTA